MTSSFLISSSLYILSLLMTQIETTEPSLMFPSYFLLNQQVTIFCPFSLHFLSLAAPLCPCTFTLIQEIFSPLEQSSNPLINLPVCFFGLPYQSHHKLGGFKTTDFFFFKSHSSGARSLKSRCPQG